jgi:hypothetical protein
MKVARSCCRRLIDWCGNTTHSTVLGSVRCIAICCSGRPELNSHSRSHDIRKTCCDTLHRILYIVSIQIIQPIWEGEVSQSVSAISPCPTVVSGQDRRNSALAHVDRCRGLLNNRSLAVLEPIEICANRHCGAGFRHRTNGTFRVSSMSRTGLCKVERRCCVRKPVDH